MIGQLHSVVLDAPDAPDAHAVATFYAELLGMEVRGDPGDDWRKDPTAPHDTLRAPRAPAARPADWPDPARPQQSHLDVRVADIDVADPVGHPFCLVWDAPLPPPAPEETP